MQVVDVDFLFGGLEAKFICCSVDVACFNAAACHPGGEPVVVVVAAIE